MERLYDKNRLINNIEYLLKKKGIKIGDFETSCGVSVGYLSRLKGNDKNDVSPSAEVLLQFSKLLDTSITLLLLSNFSALTETEIFVSNFLEKLIQRTEKNELLWERHNGIDIYLMDDGEFIFPLMIEDYDSFGNENPYLKSLFCDQRLYVSSDFFVLRDKNYEYYLLPVNGQCSNLHQLEFYLLLPHKQVRKICYSGEDTKDAIAKLLENLYSSVVESCKQVRIDSDVKKAIEQFLTEKVF